jgi:hypothetical protein
MSLRLQQSIKSRLRIRRRCIVAESALKTGLSLEWAPVGEDGAELKAGRKSIQEFAEGKSRETVRIGWRENLGMGTELGGGEFE